MLLILTDGTPQLIHLLKCQSCALEHLAQEVYVLLPPIGRLRDRQEVRLRGLLVTGEEARGTARQFGVQVQVNKDLALKPEANRQCREGSASLSDTGSSSGAVWLEPDCIWFSTKDLAASEMLCEATMRCSGEFMVRWNPKPL